MVPYIVLILVILIILVIYKYKDMVSDYNSVLIRIHHGENEIDELLNKKADLLDEICESINNINDNRVFSSVKKVIKKNLDTMKLDKDLSEIGLELKEYLLVNKAFIPDEELKKKLDDLVELDLNLEATKVYYNDNSTTFNELIEKFPSKIIAKRKGYDFKNLYTFKEEQLFEILKKDNKKKEQEA